MPPKRIAGDCFDASEILIELKFGEGGEDSKLFVHQLFLAYTKYATSLGFKTELLDAEDGHVLAKIVGKNVFRAFQHETGSHVCQRVPETERRGRRHTSLIAVAVLPIRATHVRPLDMKQVEIITQRKGGPGGQHRNKTDSAVRAKHVPTGIAVFWMALDYPEQRKLFTDILSRSSCTLTSAAS